MKMKKGKGTVLPLEGYRVTDFAIMAAGPLVGSILADFGAEVIKIETKARIDPMRMGAENLERNPETDPAFLHSNRGKLGITLNFNKEKSKEIAKELVKKSDVVVENFSTGVMDRWGLGYSSLKEVKPDLVMVSLSTPGAYGPLKDVITYGPSAGSLAGIDGLAGYENDRPLGTQGYYCDWNSPIHAAFAILVALWHRDRTGKGQYIDAAQWPLTVNVIGEAVMDYTMNRRVMKPRGNHVPGFAPGNVYPCKGEDKWVSISIHNQEEWDGFCKAICEPAWTKDPRFADQFCRQENRASLDKLVGEWTKNYTHYEVTEILQKAGVAAMPYMDGSERFLDAHLQERKAYIEIDHPVMGSRLIGGVPWVLSRTPGLVRRPAPLIGEHNDYVFGKILGLSPKEISELTEEQVIC